MADILLELGLQMNRKGWIVCPFHSDHEPSCKVYEKSFFCYACQTGGDCIKFVQLYMNVAPLKAAQWLARFYGIDTDRAETEKERNARERRERERKLRTEWEQWQERAWKVLVNYHQELIACKNAGEIVRWAQETVFVEHYIHMLLENPVEFNKIYQGAVERLWQRK